MSAVPSGFAVFRQRWSVAGSPVTPAVLVRCYTRWQVKEQRWAVGRTLAIARVETLAGFPVRALLFSTHSSTNCALTAMIFTCRAASQIASSSACFACRSSSVSKARPAAETTIAAMNNNHAFFITNSKDHHPHWRWLFPTRPYAVSFLLSSPREPDASISAACSLVFFVIATPPSIRASSSIRSSLPRRAIPVLVDLPSVILCIR